MGKPLIDKLFRVTDARTFTVRGKTVLIYLRTIGGMDESARNDYAVAASRVMLRALRQQGTPEWNQYMNLDGYNRQELTERAVNLKRPSFVREASYSFHRETDPEPPEHPTITEVVEAAEEIDRLDAEVVKEQTSFVGQALAEYRASLDEMDDLTLVEEVRGMLTDALLSGAYGQASNSYTLYAACYEDADYRRKYFATPQEVYEADPLLVQTLLAAYIELDAFSQSPEELKN